VSGFKTGYCLGVGIEVLFMIFCEALDSGKSSESFVKGGKKQKEFLRVKFFA